jgi:hypothetical protein
MLIKGPVFRESSVETDTGEGFGAQGLGSR